MTQLAQGGKPWTSWGWSMFRYALASCLFAASAFAGPVVPEGVRLLFSPRGQTHFRENLNSVLLANDIDLSRNHWDEIAFNLNGPLKGFTLPRLNPYFYGFPIKPPAIEAKLSGADLNVRFQAMGAEIDPAGPAAYGFPNSSGVIVRMHLEADDLVFSTTSLRLLDHANPDFFGVLGADGFSSRVTPGRSVRLRAEIPILVEADGKKATLQILAIEPVLPKGILTTDFDRIFTPTIEMVVNGRSYAFEKAAFENDLREQLPQIGNKLALAVEKYFEGDGKKLIQLQFDKLAKSLNIKFEVQGLQILLRPKVVETTASQLAGLRFDTEIKDPLLKEGLGLFPTLGTAGEATLDSIDGTSFDAALTIHPATINGVLDRMTANGKIPDLGMGSDDEGKPAKIKILESPVIRLSDLPKSNQANLHVKVGYVVTGWGGVLFKGPIPIELDLVVRFSPNEKNEIDVFVEHIDETTLVVDTHATWLAPIRSLVDSMVRKQVAKMNSTVKEKGDSAAHFSIPTLDDLIGIPLRLKQVKTEKGRRRLF